MPRGKSNQNTEILEYALSHLEKERDDIQAKIDTIRRQLGARSGASSGTPSISSSLASPSTSRKKRVLSEAARKRIAAAQKRRWAEHRKATKAAE